MRIAVWHNLPSGGGLRLLDDHLRGLTARGHEVHVWSPPTAAVSTYVEAVASTHRVPLSDTSRQRGAEKLRSAWRGRLPELEAIVEHSARCAREMEDIDPDIVFAHPGRSYCPPSIATLVDTPSVCYLQEPNRRLVEATFGLPWLARHPHRRAPSPASVRRFVAELIDVELERIRWRTEMDWVGAFDEVLVNSAFSRESVLRAYGRSARVCSPGIDLTRFSLRQRPSRSRGSVLFVGALAVEKNPVFLVRAVHAAGAVVQRFVWVANHVDERCRREVEEEVRTLGLTFELRHGVSDTELLRRYAEADVFVYAPRLEPFGLAPLEANATGLPVVAVAEGGVRETIIDGVNGVIVDHDVEAFGRAVADLLSDVGRARALGRSGHDHVVAHWSIGASIDQLEANLAALAARADLAGPAERRDGAA